MSCTAPNCEQTKVSRIIIGYHADLFKPSYLKYKDAEAQVVDIIQRTNLAIHSIAELLHQYAQVRGVYGQRFTS